jgi:hypothetical protein
MLFLKLNRGKLHDKKKSNIISIGDHIYPHDKTLSIPNLLDWTKDVQDKAYLSSGQLLNNHIYPVDRSCPLDR